MSLFDLVRDPEFRPLQATWFGDTPQRWSVAPARALFRERNETGFPDAEMLSVTIGRGVVRQADYLSRTGNKDGSNLDRSRYKRVRPGDIVYNKMRAWQGAVGLSQFEGIVSPAYVVVRATGLSPEYAAATLRLPSFAKEAERWSYGITSDMWSLRPEHFKMIDFPVPSAPEQAAIVKYLRHAHARIDRAIAAKRKLIALLEEEKQAIIHQAVTCGLDPTVPFKDSGVTWLGQVPEHWDIAPIARFAKVGNGSTPARSNAEYWVGGDYPWLNSSVVNQSEVTSANQFVTSLALRECHLPIVQPGSVLVGITGQGKTRGKASLLRVEATINQHLAFVAPHSPALQPAYLRDVLGAAYGELRRLSDDSGSTKGALTCQDLKAFRIPLAPIHEQAAIVDLIGERTAVSMTTQTRLHREITLLQEFRVRVTSDVVTGQVDVREVAASLPDLTDDQLPDDDEAFDPVDDAEEYLVAGQA